MSMRHRLGRLAVPGVLWLVLPLWQTSVSADPPPLANAKVFHSFQVGLGAWDVDAVGARGVTQTWDFTQAFVGARAHREWETTQLLPRPRNVFPVTEGSTLTGRAQFELAGDWSQNLCVGARLSVYDSAGHRANDRVWGITPPYRANWATGLEEPASVDGLWGYDNKRSLWYAAGSFSPLLASDHIFRGQPNPAASGPAYLPLYGVQRSSRFFNPFYPPRVVHELFAGRLADSSPYKPWVAGGTIGWDRNRSRVLLSFAALQTGSGGPGLIPGPAQGAALTWSPGTVGKQRQTLCGAEGSLNLRAGQKVFGAFGQSTYRPSTQRGGKRSGQLLAAGVTSKLGPADVTAEYLSVHPAYDPAVIPEYAAPGAPPAPFFHEAPYPTTYFGSYYLHDTRKYPHNREGVRLHVDYPFPGKLHFGQLGLDYERLRQREPSTVANLTTAGFTEPLFRAGTATGAAANGVAERLGATVFFSLPRNRRVSAAYHAVDISRPAPDASRMDLDLSFASFSYGVPLTYKTQEKMYVDVGLGIAKASGRFLSTAGNVDVTQTSPSVALSYQFTQSPDILRNAALKLRWLNQKDRSAAGSMGDLRAMQVSVEGTLDF